MVPRLNRPIAESDSIRQWDFLFFIGETDKGEKKMTRREIETYIWDTAAECMSRDELHTLQSARLRDCVRRMYDNVPYYRKTSVMSTIFRNCRLPISSTFATTTRSERWLYRARTSCAFMLPQERPAG